MEDRTANERFGGNTVRPSQKVQVLGQFFVRNQQSNLTSQKVESVGQNGAAYRDIAVQRLSLWTSSAGPPLLQRSSEDLGAQTSSGSVTGGTITLGADAARTPDPVNELRAQWINNVQRKDLTGLLALYADDAALLPPSGERISGKDKIAAYFKHLFDSATSLAIQLSSDKSQSAGELAYDTGRYQKTLSARVPDVLGGGAIGSVRQTRHSGSYLMVLIRENGRWLISQHAETEKRSH